jgi:hypothetical protein
MYLSLGNYSMEHPPRRGSYSGSLFSSREVPPPIQGSVTGPAGHPRAPRRRCLPARLPRLPSWLARPTTDCYGPFLWN